MLCAAIDDFARTTAERFHGGEAAPTAELLERYARDHLREGAVSGAGYYRRSRSPGLLSLTDTGSKKR
jgi:hypothetical protein